MREKDGPYPEETRVRVHVHDSPLSQEEICVHGLLWQQAGTVVLATSQAGERYDDLQQQSESRSTLQREVAHGFEGCQSHVAYANMAAEDWSVVDE